MFSGIVQSAMIRCRHLSKACPPAGESIALHVGLIVGGIPDTSKRVGPTIEEEFRGLKEG